jgi:hypothetical protein
VARRRLHHDARRAGRLRGDRPRRLCGRFVRRRAAARPQPPDRKRYPVDRGRNFYKYKQLAVPLEEVQANFEIYGLLDDQVRFVKGLFSDTLPKLQAERFALIRLDGDLYESTMDGLRALYPRLSSGGFVVIDDYALRSSRTAVHDYLAEIGEQVQFERIDDYSVWWRKP